MPPSIDDAAREIAQRWEAAWNAHDMSLMSGLLTDDVDFVNVLGSHWKGRAAVERVHVSMHATQFHQSVWQTHSVVAQAVAPEVVLVHVKWSISGDHDTDGTPRQPRTGVFSWLLMPRDGRWLIRAAHNTNVTVLRRP